MIDGFDWDAYFERKQDLLFRLWAEEYEGKIEKARHKEFAIQYYALPYLAGQVKTNPFNGGGPWSGDPDQQIFNDLEATFFQNVYRTFKSVWLLTTERPVAEFVNVHLWELVRVYLIELYSQKPDWDMMEMAAPLADAFIRSRQLIRRSIIRWITYRFALERMLHLLEDKFSVTINDTTTLENYMNVSVGTLYTPTSNKDAHIQMPVEKRPLQEFADKHPKMVTGVGKPKRESTSEDYLFINQEIDRLMASGMKKAAAIEAVLAEQGKGKRTIYRALREKR